eukprot:747868-Hanusia_phi.AAC.1
MNIESFKDNKEDGRGVVRAQKERSGQSRGRHKEKLSRRRTQSLPPCMTEARMHFMLNPYTSFQKLTFWFCSTHHDPWTCARPWTPCTPYPRSHRSIEQPCPLLSATSQGRMYMYRPDQEGLDRRRRGRRGGWEGAGGGRWQWASRAFGGSWGGGREERGRGRGRGREEEGDKDEGVEGNNGF